MGQQNWVSYKQIKVYLSYDELEIILQNCLGSILIKASLHTLYNISALAALLQGYATLLCNSPKLRSIDLVLLSHNIW